MNIAPPKMSRGLRNHNPGNVRRVKGQDWKGELPIDPTDPRYDAAFEQFVAPVWGLRAMAKIILKYQSKHACDTIRKIINRWAPPNENDTESYILHCADTVGVSADQTIKLSADTKRFAMLMATIIKHENGAQPYELDLIEQGIALAMQGELNV